MEEHNKVFMRITTYIRKNPKTTWGKNQLLDLLDQMEQTIDNESK